MDTHVVLLTKITDVEFSCPCCGEEFRIPFDEFLKKNRLDFSDYPDWVYDTITCPECQQELEASYEID